MAAEDTVRHPREQLKGRHISALDPGLGCNGEQTRRTGIVRPVQGMSEAWQTYPTVAVIRHDSFGHSLGPGRIGHCRNTLNEYRSLLHCAGKTPAHSEQAR